MDSPVQPKRRLDDTLTTPSTSSSCESPSKETSQRLQDEHSYINMDSPVQPKQRLDDTLATPSTSSSCESPSKETSQRLQDEHSYSNMG